MCNFKSAVVLPIDGFSVANLVGSFFSQNSLPLEIDGFLGTCAEKLLAIYTPIQGRKKLHQSV